MNAEKQQQYLVKVFGALNEVFNEDSENYIGIEELDSDEENLKDFLHVISLSAPQYVFAKLTKEEPDPIEFLGMATRLLFESNERAK